MSRSYCKYLDSHFPYNQVKERVGLGKIKRGWVGFWQFKGNQKYRYKAHVIRKKFILLPLAND